MNETYLRNCFVKMTTLIRMKQVIERVWNSRTRRMETRTRWVEAGTYKLVSGGGGASSSSAGSGASTASSSSTLTPSSPSTPSPEASAYARVTAYLNRRGQKTVYSPSVTAKLHVFRNCSGCSKPNSVNFFTEKDRGAGNRRQICPTCLGKIADRSGQRNQMD